ncbi:uncharacterized protein LOC143292111 [Babylonia areolata]|uniref:uncharacterized protein LOC143292111 n=1 Tax=Babylonia areolata TaxID=304850 RepID=UPI003FCF5B59
MAPQISLFPLLLVFSACLTHAAKTSVPKDMHQDMYCIGCEMTMKVMDRALRNTAKDRLEDAVSQALGNVCKRDHFDISEYSQDTINTACQHIIKNYRTELKRELVSEYGREKRSSYLDLVQRVCMMLTDACHGVMHDDHDHDPLKDDARVRLDPETNDFVVVPGKNLKVARPVSQTREEL